MKPTNDHEHHGRTPAGRLLQETPSPRLPRQALPPAPPRVVLQPRLAPVHLRRRRVEVELRVHLREVRGVRRGRDQAGEEAGQEVRRAGDAARGPAPPVGARGRGRGYGHVGRTGGEAGRVPLRARRRPAGQPRAGLRLAGFRPGPRPDRSGGGGCKCQPVLVRVSGGRGAEARQHTQVPGGAAPVRSAALHAQVAVVCVPFRRHYGPAGSARRRRAGTQTDVPLPVPRLKVRVPQVRSPVAPLLRPLDPIPGPGHGPVRRLRPGRPHGTAGSVRQAPQHDTTGRRRGVHGTGHEGRGERRGRGGGQGGRRRDGRGAAEGGPRGAEAGRGGEGRDEGEAEVLPSDARQG